MSFLSILIIEKQSQVLIPATNSKQAQAAGSARASA